MAALPVKDNVVNRSNSNESHGSTTTSDEESETVFERCGLPIVNQGIMFLSNSNLFSADYSLTSTYKSPPYLTPEAPVEGSKLQAKCYRVNPLDAVPTRLGQTQITDFWRQRKSRTQKPKDIRTDVDNKACTSQNLSPESTDDDVQTSRAQGDSIENTAKSRGPPDKPDTVPRNLRQTKMTDFWRQRESKTQKLKDMPMSVPDKTCASRNLIPSDMNDDNVGSPKFQAYGNTTQSRGADVPHAFPRKLRQTKMTDFWPKRKNRRKKLLQDMSLDIYNKGSLFVGDNPTCNLVIDPVIFNGGTSESDRVCMSPTRAPLLYLNGDILKMREDFLYVRSVHNERRDNAKWEEFFRGNTNMRQVAAKENIFKDVGILLMFEHAVGLRYQGKDKGCKKMIKKALEVITITPSAKLIMKDALVALAHSELSSVCWRHNDAGGAEYNISVALQNLEFLPFNLLPLVQAYVTYKYANVVFRRGDEESAFFALQMYDKCIDICERMYRAGESSYNRLDDFSRLRKADILLNNHTAAARRRAVGQENIKKAWKCISSVARRHEGEMGESLKMLFDSVMSAYHGRIGDQRNAVECSRKALEQAEKIGFVVQIDQLRERFTEIKSSESENDTAVSVVQTKDRPD